MFSEDAINFIVASVMLAACWAAGALLLPGLQRRIECPLARVALRTGWGVLFGTGAAAVAVSGRFCLGAAVPALQLAVTGWLWRARKRAQEPVHDKAQLTPWLPLLITWTAVCAWVFWFFEWKAGQGLRALHSDLGFWARQVLALPEAGISNSWAATLGAETASAGLGDSWYHWGTLWLAGLAGMLTGLPPLALLLKITSAVMVMSMVMLSASLTHLLARTGASLSLLCGAAALVAVQWIKMYGVLWLEMWLPYGSLQHTRLSVLAYQGYHLEGVLILMVLAAWQMRLPALAALLVFFSGLSAPHNVAVLGIATGSLMIAGLLLRRRHLWQPAAAAVGLLLLSWGTVKLVFGVEQIMAEGQSLLVPDVMALWKRFSDGWIDAGCGLLLELLLLPGLVHLVRQPSGEDGGLRSALGWLAFSALAGSYLGYHLLRHVSDVFHFTVLAHAAIVVPVSMWGLLAAWRSSRFWGRLAFPALAVIATLMGAHDMSQARKRHKTMPYSPDVLDQVRAELRGRPFGYFAISDRQWWISKHSVLAAWLESRCARLNRIESIESSADSRFYGGSFLETWLPRGQQESPADWSLRLLRRIGGRHVLETPEDPIPDEIRSRLRPVAGDETLRLHELVE